MTRKEKIINDVLLRCHVFTASYLYGFDFDDEGRTYIYKKSICGNKRTIYATPDEVSDFKCNYDFQ